ncbi:MAG TPA: aspartate aminotransferase family protein [Pirellulales bacterium]|nr:aspartate aminotransferase family protein [Pirellulales bacterium]
MTNTFLDLPGRATVDRKARHSWPCVYHFYEDPPVIARGDGAFLYDRLGKRYLDCYSGVGVMSAGHSRKEIVAAVAAQAAQLQHTTSIYLSEPVWRLAEELARIAPGDLCRSFFCASGSEANEASFLLAALVTGRKDYIAFNGGLHGRTKAAMSATGLPVWRTDPDPLATFHHAPSPTDPSCLDGVETLLRRHEVAAVIIEPVQGNGGVIVPPGGFLSQLQALCRRHGSLLIFDEVQTGINRTGHWFASEWSGVVPDVATVAKALGNGWPIAAALTTDALAAAYSRPGASTYGGNPMSCAAALAVLALHEREQLGPRARCLGAWLRTALEERLAGVASVGEIRGLGLMLGIEIVEPGGLPAPDALTKLLEDLKDAGFLAGRTGKFRNVLTLMPPLVVEQDDLGDLVDAITDRLGFAAN